MLYSFLSRHYFNRMRPALGICKRGKKSVRDNNRREHQDVGKGRANNVTTTEKLNGSMLLLLPMHLVSDILARLPIYTIFDCKRVCKTFKKILSDPYFAQVHLEKASLSDDYSLLFMNVKNPSKSFLAPVVDLDKPAVYSKKPSHPSVAEFFSWQTLSLPSFIANKKRWDVMGEVFGSYNGLLCVRFIVGSTQEYCVCNPLLGEFTFLPQPMPLQDQFASFGFCPKTKQHKVLRFNSRLGYCVILTLGIDDEWRKISDTPTFPLTSRSLDSSFRGNLHWIIEPLHARTSICSFNLETEKHLYMSLPSCFDIEFCSKVYDIHIGTLDGLFCVSFMIVPGLFEVYVMADYGVKESWSKKISIDLSNRVDLSEKIRIVRFLYNGALVLSSGFPRQVYFNTRNRTTSYVNVEDYNVSVTALTPSFLSLNDIVRRENVEQVERSILQFFSSEAGKPPHKFNGVWSYCPDNYDSSGLGL